MAKLGNFWVFGILEHSKMTFPATLCNLRAELLGKESDWSFLPYLQQIANLNNNRKIIKKEHFWSAKMENSLAFHLYLAIKIYQLPLNYSSSSSPTWWYPSMYIYIYIYTHTYYTIISVGNTNPLVIRDTFTMLSYMWMHWAAAFQAAYLQKKNVEHWTLKFI